MIKFYNLLPHLAMNLGYMCIANVYSKYMRISLTD